ncbi:hypothetical protein [Poriferisphaera sp. WC338]|uniref:hypothetical protein n=1 Tax=Poriferisphaera sp. WC338 TaxID=3425129 RepID=UPI003D81C489
MKKRMLCMSVGVLLCSSMINASPITVSSPIGLRDALHTDDEGKQISLLGDVSNGYVVGQSYRYSGQAAKGTSAWRHDVEAGMTIRIGLIDDLHTYKNDSSQWSNRQGNRATKVNGSGHIIGQADRYDNTSKRGESAWYFNGISTKQIGLQGGVHTKSNGQVRNIAEKISDGGYAVGYAERYNNFLSAGQSVWQYDAEADTTTQIGLYAGKHLGTGSTAHAQVMQLTTSGEVIGSSTQYNNAGFIMGQSAWLYDGVSTIQLGLEASQPSIYLNASNQSSYSNAVAINNNQAVIGFSNRQDSAVQNRTAWLYDGNYTLLGLHDSIHQNASGYSNTNPVALNNLNHVVGTATRYAGDTESGLSAWYFDGRSTSRIGFYDNIEHSTINDPYSVSVVTKLNDRGQAIGYSERFYEAFDSEFGEFYAESNGQSAWIYDSQVDTHSRLGFSDAAHTGDNQYQYSEAQFLSDTGYVAGYSEYFTSGTASGQTAWIYDTATEMTTSLVFSTSSSGERYSELLALFDNGTVIGKFDLYTNGQSEMHFFLYSQADGMIDLTDILNTQLISAGWESINANTILSSRISSSGDVVGFGTPSENNESLLAFLISTPIPEPTALLVFAGFSLLGVLRRKHI